MPRSRWAIAFIGLFAPRGGRVVLDDGVLTISVGALGSARVPVERIARITPMGWPPIGGLGVRIGRGLVGFVLESGPCLMLELDEEIRVRAPLGWSTAKVVVRVDDPGRLAAALAAARGS